MGAWDAYRDRMNEYGFTKRGMLNVHTKAALRRRMVDSLSWHTVTINGVDQEISVAHTQDMSEKKIFSMPDESLKHGGIVEFADNRWIVMEVDADNEIYQRGLMKQCNYVLKWIGADGKLREKWCIVEDGTKYLIGEKASQMMTVGDARIAVTVGKDEDTVELSRGMRFLIDDTDSEHVLAYQITKPNKLFNIYNNEGVFRFILTEVNLEDGDNTELRIADYANWTPHEETDGAHVNSPFTVAQIVQQAIDKTSEPFDDEKGVWL